MAFALFCNTCRRVSELGVGEPPAPILTDELQALTTSKAADSARPKKMDPLNVFISNCLSKCSQTSSIAVKTPAHRTGSPVCGSSRAKYRWRIFTAEFSSRSMTNPHSVQPYVRFHKGMDCM